MARKTTASDREFEDVSSFSSSEKSTSGPTARRRFSPKRLAAMAACLLLAFAGVGLMMLASHLDGMAAAAASFSRDPENLGIDEQNLSVEGVTNIAVFGVDSRTGEYSGAADLTMILTVDQVHQKIKMTSLLPNALVAVEGAGSGEKTANTETALCKAFESGGPESAIRTLNRSFGLDIQNYVALNFRGMAAVVDALGGVEVRLTAEEAREINVNLQMMERDAAAALAVDPNREAELPKVLPEDYIPDASGTVKVNSGNYAGGIYRLNGNQAVAYGRIRSIDSEAVRTDRQQVVLNQLLRILRADRTRDLSAWAKLLLPYCSTSLEVRDIVAVAGILTQSPALEAIKVPDGYFEESTVETAADGTAVLSFDRKEAARRIQAFIFEEKAASWSEYGNTGINADRNSSMD